uniref:Tetratricopeptide repeat protein 38 n=1 Tax=Meloidogyne hapla TaxID=6305 RepID=A0A1I8C0Y0_MELHA
MYRACNEWENILEEYPNDLMALKFAHTGYFYTGDHLAMRDSIARLIDKWDKEKYQCYSYLHGMHAYGLEECGEYIEAEKQAKIGLQLQRQDCWSTHAIAHCMEMASDFKNGINFLESTENDWGPCKLLHGHNYWHNALFYIEKGDFESALTIYDNELAPKSSKKSFTIMELIDASSLLSRLEMEIINVGRERWEGLIPLVAPHIGDQIVAFNDAHISMVLSRLDENIDGKENLAYLHAKNISNFIGDKQNIGENATIMRDFGEKLCSSIYLFNKEKYDQAFDDLYSIKSQFYRLSGSHAQKDIFTQFLVCSGLYSQDKEKNKKALEVLQERGAKMRDSALALRLVKRYEDGIFSKR